jgi:hypothetical protein
MMQSEESRADLVRGLSERLSIVESQFAASPERAERARELAHRLVVTLDHVERAMGRRHLAQRRLKETQGAWGSVLGELRATLARAEQTERDAGEAFSNVLQSARDALTAWNVA